MLGPLAVRTKTALKPIRDRDTYLGLRDTRELTLEEISLMMGRRKSSTVPPASSFMGFDVGSGPDYTTAALVEHGTVQKSYVLEGLEFRQEIEMPTQWVGSDGTVVQLPRLEEQDE